MTPRIGSLFSGYGGLEMAVQAVYGGEVVWYSEIDKHACTVLEALHPTVPNLGDITAVNWAAVPPIDILTGGYPCQPFSHAGQRKGTNDERHLWPYVRDAIVALRPVVTVLENVDGHRSLGLDVVLGDLADLGLSARWGVVRAADAGAPHGRKRVFIVVTDPDQRGRNEDVQQSRDLAAQAREGQSSIPHGHRADGLAADANAVGLPLTQHESRSARRRSDAGLGALTTGSSLGQRGSAASPASDADSDGHGGELHPAGVARVEGLHEGTPRERERPRPKPVPGGGVAAADARRFSKRASAVEAGSGLVASITGGAELGSGGYGQHATDGVNWGKYAPAIRRWESLTRPAPDPTILGANGRPRLSPAFVEWMMGLPVGHVTGHGLKPAACLKMLGNGVVPQQAELALRMLAAADA